MNKVPADIKREWYRVYYVANREHILAHQREYRAANRERLNQRLREYRAANRERLNEHRRYLRKKKLMESV